MSDLARLHEIIDLLPPEKVRELLVTLEARASPAEPEAPKGITVDKLKQMLDL